VGKSFISQLKALTERLSRNASPTNLTLVLVSRSKSMIYTTDYSPLVMNNYKQEVADSKQEMLLLAKVVDYLAAALGTQFLSTIPTRKTWPTNTPISSPAV